MNPSSGELQYLRVFASVCSLQSLIAVPLGVSYSRRIHQASEDVQLIRVSDSKTNFLYGSLAQLVEQRTFNPQVPGSSPGRPTYDHITSPHRR